jgi:hypothetical protein
MVGRIVKMAAYAKAPLKTFVMMHPVRALKWGATYLVVKKVLDMRQHRSGRLHRTPSGQPAA